MVEEAAGTGIQGFDGGQVFRAQFEIQHSEIFLHPLPARGFGERDDSALGDPAQDDLGHAFPVFGRDAQQQFVLKDIVPAFGERRPSLDLHVVLLQKRLRLELLLEGVHFDLVDRGRDLVMDHQVHEAVGLKVGDADGPDFALLIQLFHGAPFAINIAEGLMDEVEVEVIELQPFQGIFEGLPGTLITVSLDPQFGGDEQLFPRHAAAFDAPADGLFIEVRSGGIDMPIAGLDGVHHAAFAFGGIGNLENTETEDGYLHAVV